METQATPTTTPFNECMKMLPKISLISMVNKNIMKIEFNQNITNRIDLCRKCVHFFRTHFNIFSYGSP